MTQESQRFRVYRFNESVAFTFSDIVGCDDKDVGTETIYISPLMALEIAKQLVLHGDDIVDRKFTDSSLGTTVLQDDRAEGPQVVPDI